MSDLISRDDALNSNYRMYDAKSGIEWIPVFHIRDLPSAEPERKNGQWIDEKINSYTSRTYCSECGNSAPFICVYGDHYGRNMQGETNKTKFCPNCGAEMS